MVPVPVEPEGPTLYHGKPAYLEAEDGTVFVLDVPTWTQPLWLANAHGWTPEATECFAFDGRQALYGGDSKRCAKAVVKGLDRWDREPPASNKGPHDTLNPLTEIAAPALFRSADQVGRMVGDQAPLMVNLWANVRAVMKNLDGVVDTTEWRRIAAFIKDSGGVTVHLGKPKVTP